MDSHNGLHILLSTIEQTYVRLPIVQLWISIMKKWRACVSAVAPSLSYYEHGEGVIQYKGFILPVLEFLIGFPILPILNQGPAATDQGWHSGWTIISEFDRVAKKGVYFLHNCDVCLSSKLHLRSNTLYLTKNSSKHCSGTKTWTKGFRVSAMSSVTGGGVGVALNMRCSWSQVSGCAAITDEGYSAPYVVLYVYTTLNHW